MQNFNTTLPVYVGRVIEGAAILVPLRLLNSLRRPFVDPQIELNYTLDEYPPGFQFQKNDTWSATLYLSSPIIVDNSNEDGHAGIPVDAQSVVQPCTMRSSTSSRTHARSLRVCRRCSATHGRSTICGTSSSWSKKMSTFRLVPTMGTKAG